jgi:hypothetical protein
LHSNFSGKEVKRGGLSGICWLSGGSTWVYDVKAVNSRSHNRPAEYRFFIGYFYIIGECSFLENGC